MDEISVDHASRNEMEGGYEKLQLGTVDCVLRSELEKNSSFGGKESVSNEREVDVLDRPPSNIVMFDVTGGSSERESASRWLLGMSSIVQAFRNRSQLDGREHGTSELESIARRRADELAIARVRRGGAEDIPPLSGIQAQPAFGQQSTTLMTLSGLCWRIVFMETRLFISIITNRSLGLALIR